MDPIRGINNKIKVLIPECLEKMHKKQSGVIFSYSGPIIFPEVNECTKLNKFNCSVSSVPTLSWENLVTANKYSII